MTFLKRWRARRRIKAMMATNEWHTDLGTAFAEIAALVGHKKKWSWVFNSSCKYVELRIDMRDGGYILKDRDNQRIGLEELKWQCNGEEGK